MTDAAGTLTGDNFAPTGVTCAAGYSGTVGYTVCATNGDYTPTGCTANTCTAGTAGPGIIPCDSTHGTTGGTTGACTCTCAAGYEGDDCGNLTPVCTCTNGVPATAAQGCATSGERCYSCSDGYTLEGTSCTENDSDDSGGGPDQCHANGVGTGKPTWPTDSTSYAKGCACGTTMCSYGSACTSTGPTAAGTCTCTADKNGFCHYNYGANDTACTGDTTAIYYVKYNVCDPDETKDTQFKCSGANVQKHVTVNATTCGTGAVLNDETETLTDACHAETDGGVVREHKKNVHTCSGGVAGDGHDDHDDHKKKIEDSAVSATVAGFAATATAVAAAVLL
jgi:hypothetical protein